MNIARFLARNIVKTSGFNARFLFQFTAYPNNLEFSGTNESFQIVPFIFLSADSDSSLSFLCLRKIKKSKLCYTVRTSVNSLLGKI